MVCQKCNASIPEKAVFCPVCGSRVETAVPVGQKEIIPEDRTVRVRRAAPGTAINDRPEEIFPEEPVSSWETQGSSREKPRYMINFISLALLVACLVLWALVPFMAVNYDTLADQPTALALLLDDVDYTGELTDAMGYWIAIVAAVGLVLCLACVLLKSRIMTRVLSVATLAPLVMTIVNVAKWAEDTEEFFDFFGIAFWGILVVMLAVTVLGGGWRKRT